MKDPSGLIRTWIYGVLNTKVTYGGSAVPVYSFAPKDAAMPYILLAGQTGSSELEESTKDTYITRHSITIEIYASGTGNRASYVPVNTISDSVVQLVRTRTKITITGYNVVSIVFDSSLTDAYISDTNTITLKVLNFTLIMEES